MVQNLILFCIQYLLQYTVPQPGVQALFGLKPGSETVRACGWRAQAITTTSKASRTSRAIAVSRRSCARTDYTCARDERFEVAAMHAFESGMEITSEMRPSVIVED